MGRVLSRSRKQKVNEIKANRDMKFEQEKKRKEGQMKWTE